MMLERDRLWGIFYGDISFSDFVETKIPSIRWKEEVNLDIKKAFDVIQKLLVHSYYEYLFVDIAVNRSLQVFEMSLKIRYKEVNGIQWNSKRPLSKLIEWFRIREYFERQDEEFFNHVRSTRNYLSHPERHNIGGGMWFHWIERIVDLINDLYADIEARKVRHQLSADLFNRLTGFFANGFKIKYLEHEILFYKVSQVVINNWANPNIGYISMLPVFDVNINDLKSPVILTLPLDNLDWNKNSIDFLDSQGNLVMLTSDLSEEEFEAIRDIRNKIQSDNQYLSVDASHHYHAGIDMDRIFRKISL